MYADTDVGPRSRGKERHRPLDPLPIGPQGGIEQGWLLKRSDGKHLLSYGNVIKDWKKRWFVIRNGVLSYSKEAVTTRDSSATENHFSLSDCSVRHSKSAQFAVVSREWLLTLCAASSAEAEAWVAALAAAGAEMSVDEQSPRPPNTRERRTLESIGTELTTSVDWEEPHATKLQRLWEGLRLSEALEGVSSGSTSGSPFEQDSEVWKLAGFQGTNPCTDFRGGGSAALSFLSWYVSAVPNAARAAITHQHQLRENTSYERGLPWAVAAINCVRLVGDLLEVVTFANTPGGYASSLRRCWALVDDEEGFFSLVLVALECVEREFEACGSKYMSFNSCLSKVKDALGELLGEEATSTCGSHVELRHALRLPPKFSVREFHALPPASKASQPEEKADKGVPHKGSKQHTSKANHERDFCIRNLVLATSVELDREIDRQTQLPSR